MFFLNQIMSCAVRICEMINLLSHSAQLFETLERLPLQTMGFDAARFCFSVTDARAENNLAGNRYNDRRFQSASYVIYLLNNNPAHISRSVMLISLRAFLFAPIHATIANIRASVASRPIFHVPDNKIPLA